MRVDYQRSEKSWSYLHYNQFSVGSASEEYPLTVGAFGGLGADWFNYNSNPHNGMKFSTLDNDNDMRSSNCATAWESGWWYNDCHCTYININSQPIYHHKYRYSSSPKIIFTEMKICPKDSIIQ